MIKSLLDGKGLMKGVHVRTYNYAPIIGNAGEFLLAAEKSGSLGSFMCVTGLTRENLLGRGFIGHTQLLGMVSALKSKITEANIFKITPVEVNNFKNQSPLTVQGSLKTLNSIDVDKKNNVEYKTSDEINEFMSFCSGKVSFSNTKLNLMKQLKAVIVSSSDDVGFYKDLDALKTHAVDNLADVKKERNMAIEARLHANNPVDSKTVWPPLISTAGAVAALVIRAVLYWIGGILEDPNELLQSLFKWVEQFIRYASTVEEPSSLVSRVIHRTLKTAIVDTHVADALANTSKALAGALSGFADGFVKSEYMMYLAAVITFGYVIVSFMITALSILMAFIDRFAINSLKNKSDTSESDISDILVLLAYMKKSGSAAARDYVLYPSLKNKIGGSGGASYGGEIIDAVRIEPLPNSYKIVSSEPLTWIRDDDIDSLLVEYMPNKAYLLPDGFVPIFMGSSHIRGFVMGYRHIPVTVYYNKRVKVGRDEIIRRRLNNRSEALNSGTIRILENIDKLQLADS